MSRFSEESAEVRLPASATGEMTASTDFARILNYPSLWRLVDGADTLALEVMRKRLQRTSGELERIVREGPANEAGRAEKATRAYHATLSLLGELSVPRKVGPES